MKIAFFLNKPNIQECDLTSILVKSYKMGGSEYEILLVSYLLEQRKGLTTYLLSNVPAKVPHQRFHKVEDLWQCCQFCVSNSINTIVIDGKQFQNTVIEYWGSRLSFIVWAHNKLDEYMLNQCLLYSCVKKIVCVSESQLEAYRSHPSYKKSCYIYNIIPFRDKAFYRHKILDRDNHNVVYMGCIRPDKGFHVLARTWPRILQNIPDAQLYVIGTGALYGCDTPLGRYGVSTQEYEDVFMPYLTDKNGCVLTSVHFMGLLGEEKWDVMGMCKVGVPNPTDSSETFCITGIEMELMGCSVTTLKLPVYEETQMNTRYLFKDEDEVAEYIVRRLEDKPDCFDDLWDFVTKKFNIEKSLDRWENLLKTNDVEYMKRYKRGVRKIEIAWFKYIFLFLIRPWNFISYRFRHHVLKSI